MAALTAQASSSGVRPGFSSTAASTRLPALATRSSTRLSRKRMYPADETRSTPTTPTPAESTRIFMRIDPSRRASTFPIRSSSAATVLAVSA